jgi:hypothetical protein
MIVSAIMGFLDSAGPVDAHCGTSSTCSMSWGFTHTARWSIGVTVSKFGLRRWSFPSKCIVHVAIIDVQ